MIVLEISTFTILAVIGAAPYLALIWLARKRYKTWRSLRRQGRR